MVRCYKKKSNKRSTYDETTLQRALAEIRRGVITQYGAHKKYGIPQMTLSYHRRGIKRQENHKKNGKSSNENIVFDDSDDDIEEEIREIEELDACMTEMDKPVTDIEKDDWVLVALSGKKSKKCYVGQVISAKKGEEELGIKFTKKVPSLDPLTCSTFAWKCPDECALIAREDILLTLPKPTFTKRGLIRFELNFSAYNIQ